MNNAYFLEAKKARFPRIIIDPEYAQELMDYNEKMYRDNAMQREINGEIIRKDTDGLYYLNYLNSISFIPDSDETAMKIFRLSQIKRSQKRDNANLRI